MEETKTALRDERLTSSGNQAVRRHNVLGHRVWR